MCKTKFFVSLTYQIPKDTRLTNLTLHVKNLKQQTDFYTDLGFKILKQTETEILLSPYGEEPFLLRLSQSLQNKHETAGLYHFAILLPDKPSLADAYYHLTHSDKFNLQGAADHGVSQAIYLSDPEGNGIEVYRDKENWNIEDFTTNPLDTENLLKEKTKDGWVGFPENTKLGHMHLQVTDVKQSHHFYGEILGLVNTASMQGASFFAMGDYHHHVGLNSWRNVTSPNENNLGLDHYTLILPNKSEFERLMENLQRNDIQITKTEESILIEDPDRIKIQIQYERK